MWEFQGEFSKVPDKDWNKTSSSLQQKNNTNNRVCRSGNTNLSIKLGFMSRLYIVKFHKGLLFKRISPTRPGNTPKQNELVQI